MQWSSQFLSLPAGLSFFSSDQTITTPRQTTTPPPFVAAVQRASLLLPAPQRLCPAQWKPAHRATLPSGLLVFSAYSRRVKKCGLKDKTCIICHRSSCTSTHEGSGFARIFAEVKDVQSWLTMLTNIRKVLRLWNWCIDEGIFKGLVFFEVLPAAGVRPPVAFGKLQAFQKANANDS